MAKKHAQFKSAIESHYLACRCTVIFENLADLQGADLNGNKVIGEFKAKNEWREQGSSWWSTWKSKLSNRVYFDAMNNLQKKARSWCAVIDGQLREYCTDENVEKGELIVEDFSACHQDITDALNCLKSNGAIRDSHCFHDQNSGLGFVTIDL